MEYPKYGMRHNGGFKSNKKRLGRREARTIEDSIFCNPI
jgi:hypothetical protein